MTATQLSIYDELAIFLAGLSPRRVLAYKISTPAQTRVSALLQKNNTLGLSTEEHAEMEKYLILEHIVRLAKAKALQKLNAQ
jgi:hypothetical protein